VQSNSQQRNDDEQTNDFCEACGKASAREDLVATAIYNGASHLAIGKGFCLVKDLGIAVVAFYDQGRDDSAMELGHAD
jgi:hypothetical protein